MEASFGEFLDVDGKDVDGMDGNKDVKRHEFKGHNSSSSFWIIFEDTGDGDRVLLEGV